jgi:xanthine dehydrogenase YagR molybdenum-binding subunit
MNRAAPEPKSNMGQPEPRIDGRLKVTGEARYASDFAVSNPAFAVLVTSTIARGSIQAMHLDEAKAVAGVLEIFTHENTAELKPVKFGGGGGGASTSIQDFGPRIQHDGQIVAMVVADTFESAREAGYKVRVVYDAEQPSATFGSPGVTEEDAARSTSGPRIRRRQAMPKGPMGRPRSSSRPNIRRPPSTTIRSSSSQRQRSGAMTS